MKESERGREKGKESGGKEVAGGGDGEGDGGKDPGKSAKIDNGKGFVFGKTPEGERSAKGSLVKHSEDDDIMQGWKEYFHKMNLKDSTCDLDESEDDDNLETRRMEGRPGKLNFTADEYAAWCMPWMNSLIIKVLGASFPTYVIRDRINRLHQVCFKCGKYGHQKTACPMELSQSDLSGNEHGIKKASNGGDGDNNMKTVGEQEPDKATVGDDGKNNLEKDSGGPKKSSGGDGVGKKESRSPEKEVRPAGRKDLVSGGEISY
ncbi:hypothetical protein K1719_046901 [Acacia pycnantha]|nr:hypothetical protein K1719_046901 [Acacia pycnantha]